MPKTIKKILFVYISAGAGHKRAASALFLHCAQKYPEIEILNIDLLDYTSLFLRKTVADLYHFTIRYAPILYGLIYKLTDNFYLAKFLNNLSGIFEKNNQKLQKIILDFNPDLIISTHFLTPAILSRFVKNIPIDTVITDYGPHNLWIAPQVRNYYVANFETAKFFTDLNLSVFVTGLPINPEFFLDKNINLIKTKFNLRPEQKTVLIMSGGFGLKNQTQLIKKTIAEFSDINLLVISGKDNKTLYQKYKSIQTSPTINYQIIKFTENMDELMRVCDVVITKPGGITLAECAYLNKKIILTEPIPGQEKKNEVYFLQNNLAIKPKTNNFTIQLRDLLEKTESKKISPPIANDLILSEALKNSP